jgi:hypothetical protein
MDTEKIASRVAAGLRTAGRSGSYMVEVEIGELTELFDPRGGWSGLSVPLTIRDWNRTLKGTAFINDRAYKRIVLDFDGSVMGKGLGSATYQLIENLIREQAKVQGLL